VLSSSFANVIFPPENATVTATSFLPSALQELQNQSKYVLFDDQGIPYGFIDNGTFKSELKYGNLTIIPGKNGSVIGSTSVEAAAKDMARLRIDGGTNFDESMLRKEDFLKYAYYSQRYGSFKNYLKDGLGLNTPNKAIDFMNQLDPQLSNEFLNLYDAADLKKVGYSHYDEILDTLNQINNEDLSKYLNKDDLQEVQKKLDSIKEDLARNALDQIKNNIGKDELNLLYKLLKQLDYKTIYKIARDYTRQLARDDTLDKIGSALSKSGVRDQVKSEFAKSAKYLVKNRLLDYLPKNIGYYLIGAGVILMVITLRRVGG